MIVKAEELPACHDEVTLQFNAKDLERSDWVSKYVYKYSIMKLIFIYSNLLIFQIFFLDCKSLSIFRIV